MSPVLGIIASSTQQGRSGNTGSYDVIATTTIGSGGVSSLTFAGLPIGYRSYEIYWTMATSVADRDLLLNFNGDYSSSYQCYIVYAGTSNNVLSYTLTGQTKIFWGGGTSQANTVASGTLTIFNPNSTTTTKATQAIYGYSFNGSTVGSSGASYLGHSLGQYASLDRINTINLSVASGVINAGSTFTLYGVR